MPSFLRHIKCILHYLIPLRLLKGQYPRYRLLERFSIEQIYSNLVESVKLGNAKEFFKCLNNPNNPFLSMGTFFCLEKCTFVLYRNLFCHIFRLNMNNVRIPFTLLLIGLQLSCGCNQTSKELEIILVSLISKHLIKGYLSHEKEFLVLSQADPFPTEFRVL